MHKLLPRSPNANPEDGHGTDTWITPQFVIDALGGWQSFNLDPCAPEIQPWPTACQRYTEAENGLIQPWEGRVWLNPPYSQKLMADFMLRLANHNHGTALIFARTETKLFFEQVWSRASAVLFVRHRLHFYHADGKIGTGNSGAPSVLVAYGNDDADILSAEPIEGKFIPLIVPRSWLIQMKDRTWREALEEFFEKHEGPVELQSIYRAFVNDPKSKDNPNYRAKLRQTLKRAQYVKVDKGLWAKREYISA